MTELPSRRGLVHVPREILASGGQAPFAGYLDRAVDLGRNRLVILAGLFVFAFLAIAVRVVELALPVVDGGDGIAQTHRVQSGSDRADIVDRNGVIVATNLATALLEADATELPDRDEVLAKLEMALPDLDIARARATLSRGSRYVTLARDLSPRQQRAVNDLGIPGLRFKKAQRRFYPLDNLLSHAVGFADVDNLGQTGLEKSTNELLSERREEVRLSIDTRVQHAVRDEVLQAMQRYKAVGAAGLVMDVNNGEVLALTSLPDFDPNASREPGTSRYFNKVTSGLYELGSTFKIITSAMTLDAGLADLDDIYDAKEPIRISRHTIRDYHPEKRPLSVAEIFLYSSNIGAAKMAMQVGTEGQQEFLERLGLFERSTIELPEVAVPNRPHPWREVRTMTIGFGHGIAVSPLQLVTGVASLVNGGRRVHPTLLRRDSDEAALGERVVSVTTSKRLRRLMRLVVGSEEGTGKKADIPGYEVGGKTGTAEKAVGGRYSRSALITSFVGIFPASDPQYIAFVMLDEPKGIPETYNFRTAGWNAAPTVGGVIRRIGPILGVSPRYDDGDEMQLASLVRVE